MAYTIRAATLEDVPKIIDLERQSPTAGHWTQQHYLEAIKPRSGGPQRPVLVAESELAMSGQELPGNRILGFLVAHHIAPEWELENIVVSTYVRRRGVATRLVDALLSEARATNSDAVFLEVRESNLAGRYLYEKAGFLETGRRRMYYAAPAEDAILYRRTLT